MAAKLKLTIIIFLFCLSVAPCFAINWEQHKSPNGATVFLDTDSIKVVDGYYFYNIKLRLPGRKDFTVSTIQSNHSHPFSACINNYKPAEYEALNGDYDNITKNKTENLEAITFQSCVHTCYKRVKTILQGANSQITIN